MTVRCISPRLSRVHALLDSPSGVLEFPVTFRRLPSARGVALTFSGVSAGTYCTGVISSGAVLYARGRGGVWQPLTRPLKYPVLPGDVFHIREPWRIGAWNDDGEVAIDYRNSPGIRHTPWIKPPESFNFEDFWATRSDLCEKLVKLQHPGIRVTSAGRYQWTAGAGPWPWKSPQTMPVWASRLTFTVGNVLVRRTLVGHSYIKTPWTFVAEGTVTRKDLL